MSRLRLLVSCATVGYLVLLAVVSVMPLDGEPPAAGWMLVAFVPVGALLVVLLGPRRWWSAAAFGVLGAAWVEAAQTIWLPSSATGWDVLWGGAGAAIGVAGGWVALLLRQHAGRPHRTPRIVAQGGMREFPRAE